MSKKIFIIVFSLFLASCAGVANQPSDTAPLTLKPSSFGDLDGWNNDDLAGFLPAYQASCARILKKSPAEAFSGDPAFGRYGDWQGPCRAAMALPAGDGAALRAFLQNNFKVMAASAGGEAQGLFTGYYESTLHGSRTKHGIYQYPLLARPADLVMVELGDFRSELKGQRIAGRVSGGKLKPYESRAEIEAGKLPPADYRPLAWLDDPHDAFFVQVQGSGTVHLDDGSAMRVGYDGQNGHPYYAIGRELVKRGVLGKDEVSMESIRNWLESHPAEAQDLMNKNPSFVFFKETPATAGDHAGPSGAEGVALTARRSLAVDHAKVPYGLPVFLVADYQDDAGRPLHRLMMAQDTGGAIRGAVRGDVFWGSGQAAEKLAGPQKAQGRYYFLLPKNL